MELLSFDSLESASPDQRYHLVTGPHIESHWFERKSVQKKIKELVTALLAFANAEGGLLIIGVEDKIVPALPASRWHTYENELRHALDSGFIQPTLRGLRIEALEVDSGEGSGNRDDGRKQRRAPCQAAGRQGVSGHVLTIAEGPLAT